MMSNPPKYKDSYWSIAHPSKGEFTMMRSKFLSFAYPINSEEEALEWVTLTQNEYYDARHICWAYRLGIQGEQTRANDDGEPSGTAGRPILGQLVASDLTNIIVLVVRYFGGIKLGTSGLIEAYRTATIDALEQAIPLEHIQEVELEVFFSYDLMGIVMRIIKELEAKISLQDFREECRLVISLRASHLSLVEDKFSKIYGVEIKPREER